MTKLKITKDQLYYLQPGALIERRFPKERNKHKSLKYENPIITRHLITKAPYWKDFDWWHKPMQVYEVKVKSDSNPIKFIGDLFRGDVYVLKQGKTPNHLPNKLFRI